MELWDVYTRDGVRTGRTAVRGRPMNPQDYHLVVHAWIRGADGRYLISQRVPTKTYPNKWETPGGAAQLGEDSLTAALREVREEVGITLRPEDGQFLTRLVHDYRRRHYAHLSDIWLFTTTETDFSIQTEEVQAARWVTVSELRAMVDDRRFIAHLFDTFPGNEAAT